MDRIVRGPSPPITRVEAHSHSRSSVTASEFDRAIIDLTKQEEHLAAQLEELRQKKKHMLDLLSSSSAPKVAPLRRPSSGSTVPGNRLDVLDEVTSRVYESDQNNGDFLAPNDTSLKGKQRPHPHLAQEQSFTPPEAREPRKRMTANGSQPLSEFSQRLNQELKVKLRELTVNPPLTEFGENDPYNFINTYLRKLGYLEHSSGQKSEARVKKSKTSFRKDQAPRTNSGTLHQPVNKAVLLHSDYVNDFDSPACSTPPSASSMKPKSVSRDRVITKDDLPIHPNPPAKVETERTSFLPKTSPDEAAPESLTVISFTKVKRTVNPSDDLRPTIGIAEDTNFCATNGSSVLKDDTGASFAEISAKDVFEASPSVERNGKIVPSFNDTTDLIRNSASPLDRYGISSVIPLSNTQSFERSDHAKHTEDRQARGITSGESHQAATIDRAGTLVKRSSPRSEPDLAISSSFIGDVLLPKMAPDNSSYVVDPVESEDVDKLPIQQLRILSIPPLDFSRIGKAQPEPVISQQNDLSSSSSNSGSRKTQSGDHSQKSSSSMRLSTPEESDHSVTFFGKSSESSSAKSEIFVRNSIIFPKQASLAVNATKLTREIEDALAGSNIPTVMAAVEKPNGSTNFKVVSPVRASATINFSEKNHAKDLIKEKEPWDDLSVLESVAEDISSQGAADDAKMADLSIKTPQSETIDHEIMDSQEVQPSFQHTTVSKTFGAQSPRSGSPVHEISSPRSLLSSVADAFSPDFDSVTDEEEIVSLKPEDNTPAHSPLSRFDVMQKASDALSNQPFDDRNLEYDVFPGEMDVSKAEFVTEPLSPRQLSGEPEDDDNAEYAVENAGSHQRDHLEQLSETYARTPTSHDFDGKDTASDQLLKSASKDFSAISVPEDVISDKSSDTSVVLSILADAPWKLHGHLPDHSAEVLGDNLGGGHVVRDPDVFGPGLDREKSGNSPENHDRGDAADSLGSLETVSPLHSFSGRGLRSHQSDCSFDQQREMVVGVRNAHRFDSLPSPKEVSVATPDAAAAPKKVSASPIEDSAPSPVQVAELRPLTPEPILKPIDIPIPGEDWMDDDFFEAMHNVIPEPLISETISESTEKLRKQGEYTRQHKVESFHSSVVYLCHHIHSSIFESRVFDFLEIAATREEEENLMVFDALIELCQEKYVFPVRSEMASPGRDKNSASNGSGLKQRIPKDKDDFTKLMLKEMDDTSARMVMPDVAQHPGKLDQDEAEQKTIYDLAFRDLERNEEEWCDFTDSESAVKEEAVRMIWDELVQEALQEVQRVRERMNAEEMPEEVSMGGW